MFETSKDILFWVIALSVAVLTGFLCWFLYYMISIIREANSVIKEVETKVRSFGELIDAIKEKFTNSSAYFGLLIKSLTSLISYVQERRTKKRNASSNAKTK
ncbi:MAG: hypothetical protein WC734_00765 [Patescibacteria group bacterium]|jgi:predicted PurR-regulated permease PerM